MGPSREQTASELHVYVIKQIVYSWARATGRGTTAYDVQKTKKNYKEKEGDVKYVT